MLQHLARTCLTRKKRKTIDRETMGWYGGGCWVRGLVKRCKGVREDLATFLLNVGTKNEKLLTKKLRDGMMVDVGLWGLAKRWKGVRRGG
jgi:hypothetical protein